MPGFEHVVKIFINRGPNLGDVRVQTWLPAAIAEPTGKLRQGLTLGDVTLGRPQGLDPVNPARAPDALQVAVHGVPAHTGPADEKDFWRDEVHHNPLVKSAPAPTRAASR